MEQHKLKQLTKSIWYLPADSSTDRPVLGYICGKQRSLAIDAGNSIEHAHLFLNELIGKQLAEPAFVALTHWHWDHIFGLPAWKAPSIANEMTKDKMEEIMEFGWSDEELDQRVEQGIEIPFCADMIKKEYGQNRHIHIVPPTITYTKQATVELGEITAEMLHVGGDHSPDSAIIFIPQEKTLFLGDCLYANMYAEKYNYTRSALKPLLKQILSFDADHYILSHQDPFCKTDFQEYAGLLLDLCEYTLFYKGNEKEIRGRLTLENGRPLNDLEEELLAYFVAGY
ncbi:MBL fold metallo-hydrolase [Bacillus sp. 1P06AnD]|uniref:MBL fold metallo-hydrolase n=1 Tax=Bacillus sp. 1P06AnD TaxID=3132208 RepID=UPI0039A32293